MLIGRRLAVGTTALVTFAAGLTAAPIALAATVSTPIIDCANDSTGNVAVPSTITTGDTLTVRVDNCQNYILDWTASEFDPHGTSGSDRPNARPYTIGSQNQVDLTLSNLLVTKAAGATIASVALGGGKTFTIVQAGTPAPSVWTAKSPPAGTIGSAYSYQFTATSGSDPYTVDSGTLPTGLSLSTSGLLSGTPTRAGTFTFAIARSGESETTGNLSVTVTGPVVDKVTLCHRTRATTNPYVLITVSVNSVIKTNGHGDHNTTRTNSVNPTNNGISPGSGPFDTGFSYPSNRKWWGDIIPPFTHSGGTYAGLNWSSDWDHPNPTPGNSSWIEDNELAAAIRDASGVNTNSVYYRAAAQCMDLANGTQSTKSAALDTPEKFFNVSVRNGEDPDSVREDLVEQEAESMGGGTPGGTPISIPTTTSLETTYNNAASVVTDAVSGIGRTSATLNGTLKSGPTWTTWKFEWAEDPEDVAGSTDNFSSTTIPAANGSGDREVEREITGLTCATSYYFRVTGNTTEVGLIRSFTTSACPGNSGGGNSGGGNSGGGNSGNNPGSTPGTGSTTPPGQTPTVGGGRPPRLTLPPAGPANRPVTPGSSSTPGTPSNPGNSNTSSPGDDDNGTSTPGTTGSQTPGTPANPVTTVFRPRNLTPTASVPAPPGAEWEPTQTRIQDPETGEPTLRVTNEAGTWTVDERSGSITYTPAAGYAGSATVNVVLIARSGEIYIHPMRVPISFTSRVKIISGDVPGDISGGVARIVRPWQR